MSSDAGYPAGPSTAGEVVESPWKTTGARASAGVNVLGGLFLGFIIGFVPIMFEYQSYVADCSRYTAADACNALTVAGCRWDNATAACVFPDHDTVACGLYENQDSCKANDACYWRYHKRVCQHRKGWDSNEQGLLAGAQIVGAMISSPTAGPLTNKIGRRASIAVCAVVGLLGTLMIAIGWAAEERYAVLVVAEAVVGLVGGWLSVICPMYCGEMAARQLEETIGVLFQLAVTFGICCAATMGLIFDPRPDTATPHAHLQERLQIVLAVQWVVTLALIPAAWAMPESTLWLQERRAKQHDTNALLDDDIARRSEDGQPAAATPSVNVFRLRYLTPLLVGVALASAQQLTGINAIMIYGPRLVGAIGLQPLVGNFCIMLWNFLTCCASVPLVRRFPPRVLYIASTSVATVACAITGLAVVPGVLPSDSTAQHVLSGLGIMAFIAAFECGIGPCFYVLAQDTFPAEVRSAGCSYTVWVQFAFNVVINWGFPVAMTAFSGGPSGDQDQGMSICFFIFAGTGLVTAAYLILRMPKSNSELRREEQLLGEDPKTRAVTNAST